MWHIFERNLSSEPDAIIGVSLIGIYFVWMMGMAIMRIRRGEHVHH